MTTTKETAASIQRLLEAQPALHRDGQGNLVNYGIDPKLVPYLCEHVRPGCRTMETGSGISSICFLILGARHHAISPDGGEADRIRAYCKEHGIPVDHFTHTAACSETVLPGMPAEPVLDLALVDGNHAFPVPCIDWYYLTRMLKKNGIMIVDDTELWSGEVLADFLDAEDVWQKLARTERFAVYRLLHDSQKVLARWWGEQPDVVRNSKLQLNPKELAQPAAPKPLEETSMQLDQVLAEIGKLPHDWHKAGSVTGDMLRAIVRHVGDRPVHHSMETGSGKTTLLFSHLSREHKVFARGWFGDFDTESITLVRASPLFNAKTVEFIEGPTQQTLPQFKFKHKLQLALIDGPHGYPFPDLEYYYIYPQLEENALLIVDDIHIPTIRHLFDFLKEDDMFRLVEVVDKSAFFRRTSAPLFRPLEDGWFLQNYNKKRFPIEYQAPEPASATEPDPAPKPVLAREAGPTSTLVQGMKSWIPVAIKKRVKHLLGRDSRHRA